MNQRLNKLIAGLKKEDLDGLLVSSSPNISYFAGMRCTDAYLVVSAKECIYLTDSRYTEALKNRLKGITLHKIGPDAQETIAALLKKLELRNVGFEAGHLTFAQYHRLRQNCAKISKIIPTKELVEQLREIKDRREIAKIRRATAIASKALRHIRRFLVPGKRELEIAAELEHFIRFAGGYSSSFEIIVASGPNSAFPHHVTSRRRLKPNEPVLIDMGVDYDGYKSDLTRVFFLGKMNPLAKKVYVIVKEAQARALKKIRPAGLINEIDRVARQYITAQGYGGFFNHNLGHGIGLEVHEKPGLSPRQDQRFKPGMVFTIEPAVYLPGKFGIRIEDMVLVTQKGAELLSGTLNQ